jgi:hypothetical protein
VESIYSEEEFRVQSYYEQGGEWVGGGGGFLATDGG